MLQLLKSLIRNKLTRFFLISGLNTAFGYGLFALFLLLGLPYPIALLISTIAGIFFNFKTVGVLVFKNHNNILIIKFLGVYGITYLCNLFCLSTFIFWGVSVYIGGAILLIPIGLLAFYLNKRFVFTSTKMINLK